MEGWKDWSLLATARDTKNHDQAPYKNQKVSSLSYSSRKLQRVSVSDQFCKGSRYNWIKIAFKTNFNKELHLIRCRTQDITIKLGQNNKRTFAEDTICTLPKLQVLIFWKMTEFLVY